MERNYFRAEATSDKPSFCIVLPPPNVTGSLHLGHALTATIQDILIRWKRMNGFNALWVPGTDHAGIATQMVVERELKEKEKKSRHDLGREKFLERVWEWKNKYGNRIREQHKVLGASLDWSRERFTMDPGVSAAVREVFVRLYEEGLIYRAQKLINWCPSCHTALSDLEVEHEEKQGSLWHIQYPVKGSDRKLTVATTRPETMLGDTAVAIHPEDERYKGLAGQSVVLPLTGREIPIIADAELVDPAFGTGVVKVTPAHDFNDYQTGLRHHLPMLNVLDEAARVNAEGGAYAGLDRYAARKKILEDLTAQGLLEKEEPHKLSVGGCQRCATVVEPRLSPQWFVKIEPLARPAIEAVEQGRTKLIPESWTNTYFHWMRNIHDWTISRQLWWGHQIPAWYCADCSPRLEATGGIDYSRAEPNVSRTPPEKCSRCGGSRLEQDPDVLDTWFSSGLWPFSTLGWPEQTPELKTFYPNSVMETGHDILFFWVARMMMFGLHFMKDVPFRTVYLHAMVRDEKGEKMSKTKGNVIDPLDIVLGAPAEQLNKNLRNKFPQGMPPHGADALRFTLASLTQQGRDIKLSLDRVAGYKAFANKLWNASRFALMNLGDFTLDDRSIKERELTLADRWILSRLQRATVETRNALEAYNFGEAASTLYQFLWAEFCDWYIELAKSSLYGEDARARDNTRAVLVFCLDRILRLLHPFMPFITEEIWQKLPMSRPADSIMISPFPEPDASLEDAAAEAEMGPVIAAIEGLRNIRGESNLPPSARITAYVQSPDARTRELLERWRGYLMPLAGLGELRVTAPGPKPALSAAFVGPRMEVFVPLAGLIDVDAERERLRKEITRSEQEVGGIKRKLDNPNFVAKAPPDVVEKDRARVEELEARISKLRDNLNRLAPEAATREVIKAEAGTVEAEVVETEDDDEDVHEIGGVEAEEEQAPEKPERKGGIAKGAVKTQAAPKARATSAKAPVEKAAAAKKAPARKAAPAKKAPAKKAAPASKAPAKKAVPVKKAAPTSKAPVKKTPAKKAPGKKAAAKKAPAKAKVPARSPAKAKVKPAARKAPARKKPSASRVAKARR
ncbi:valine--tRNA ligase [Archangium sp.]|uniref:valine--tRNA ligase n=1 Tax=Archangium sp. TaxID=1872627 RepID=UPI002D68A833|nr:valine--tRNA ligase [Archangium sp.]HYO57770.1 valine--tRNA ligase [Archangium sp.]